MRYFFAVIALSFSLLATADDGFRQLDIFGWVERVRIDAIGLEVKTKLDTGAKTASLDARNIRVVRQGEKRYVRFDFIDPESGDVYPMKLPRVRGVRIVRHSGNHQRRHVVEMSICLGDNRETIEVSLIDRSNFTYPLLLGRTALKRHGLIDPGETFIQYPHCKPVQPTVEPVGAEIEEDPDTLDYDVEADEGSESEAEAEEDDPA
jgi:hypothetical protein